MSCRFVFGGFALLMFSILVGFSSVASAQTGALRVEVLSSATPVFSAAEDGASVKMKVKKGRKLVTQGEPEGGFYKIVTKSGQALFIREDDVRVLGPKASVEDDLVSGDEARSGRSAQSGPGEEGGVPEKWRLTFDLGVSMGSVGNTNYTEGNLGVNLYFNRYIALRNALFGRFASGLDTTYGLDTSVRGIYTADLGPVGDLTTFGGPGYRFINEGKNVPFAEGGIVFRVLGFALGGGVKTLFNKFVDKNMENDTQYFIILSGGGSL